MLLNEDRKEKNKDPSLTQRKTLLENIFFILQLDENSSFYKLQGTKKCKKYLFQILWHVLKPQG